MSPDRNISPFPDFHPSSAHRGVTLIEVMIAMALGLIVMMALTTIFINNSQARRELDGAAQQLENGRYAMQILKDELSLAGFYDALNLVTGTTAAPCSETLAEWRDSLLVAVQVVNGGSFACVDTPKADTGMIFTQRTATATTAPGALIAGQAYMQVSLCGTEYNTSAAERMRLGTTATTTFDRRDIDCAAALAPIRRHLRHIFFIDDDNVAGDGIPTLKRADFGPGQTLGAAQALVEGIDDLHFEVALDTDGNGSPDTFTDVLAGVAWENVVGVRVWLIARAIQPSPGYTDDKTYQLGTKAPYQPADAFKRHVFSTYIELINPAGRRQR